MPCSPMLGQFIREDKPLTVTDLVIAYAMTRSRVEQEIVKMALDGHIEPCEVVGEWQVTAEGREAWFDDD